VTTGPRSSTAARRSSSLPCGHVPAWALREPIQGPDGVPLVLRGQVRVPEDHGVGLVAEDRPDGIEGHPGLDHERGPRVAQIVEAESCESCSRNGDPERPADDRWCQRLPFGRAEDGAACDRSREALELGDEGVAQRHCAVLAVLRIAEGRRSLGPRSPGENVGLAGV